MPFYTAYTPPVDDISGDSNEALARVQVLKDGFSFPAFIFTGLWLLSKKLWLGFLVFAVFYGLLLLMQVNLGLSALALAIAQFALGLFLGFEGHSLWGSKLLAKGWRLADVVEARNQDEAERRFFERALMAADPALERPALPVATPSPRPLPRPAAHGVIGMFPESASR